MMDCLKFVEENVGDLERYLAITGTARIVEGGA